MIEPQSVRRAFSRKATTGVLIFLGTLVYAALGLHVVGKISETLARAIIDAALLYGVGQTGVYMVGGVAGLREDTKREIARATKPEAQP